MSTSASLVIVVDDDESLRESLPELLSTYGYRAVAFASAEDFLASGRIGDTSCLVLDIAMPGMSGLDLQRELKRRRHSIPIVFITAHTSQVDRERLMKQGAIACLFKPFDPSALIDAIKVAVPAR